MTNEEAISILERMLDEFYNEDSYAPECKDAVDMAIEALKAQSKHSQNTSSKQPDLDTLGIKTGETCEDVIRRQDAIDALKEYEKRVETAEQLWTIRGCKDEFLKLPSAQPEQQWIPCSERLPEKSGQYYVSGGGKVWICKFLIIPNFSGGWCNNVSNPAVQAWTPLPEEPYKGES